VANQGDYDLLLVGLGNLFFEGTIRVKLVLPLDYQSGPID
jgi:hypothetical protein